LWYWSSTFSFGNGFGEIREQHRQPQPEGDLELEAEPGAALQRVLDEPPGREHAADLHHEHDRILDQRARVELDEGGCDGREDDLGIEQRGHRHLLAKH
jgi:hypothetical protein